MNTRREFAIAIAAAGATALGVVKVGDAIAHAEAADPRIGYDSFEFYEHKGEYVDDAGERHPTTVLGWNGTFAGVPYGSYVHITDELTDLVRCEMLEILALQANMVLQEIALKKVVFCDGKIVSGPFAGEAWGTVDRYRL